MNFISNLEPRQPFQLLHALVYLGAALAGFKQEYVYEWFDSILKVFFRTPPATPKQLDAGAK